MRIGGLILPVVAGAVAGILLISGGEIMLHHYFPFPPLTDESNAQSVAAAMKQMPDMAFKLLLLNYIFASFTAGIIATLVAKRTKIIPALVVGIVLTLSAVYNLIMLPHPLWFTLANLMVYMPFTYFGYIVSGKKAVRPEA